MILMNHSSLYVDYKPNELNASFKKMHACKFGLVLRSPQYIFVVHRPIVPKQSEHETKFECTHLYMKKKILVATF